MSSITRQHITAVILAGGRARRMGGQDKGLLKLGEQRLLDIVVDSIRPQCGTLLINANRNLDDYASAGYPVVADSIGDYAGPLAGIHAAMLAANTPWLFCCPCDSPFIPEDLIERFIDALNSSADTPDLVIAHDGERLQPVFALLHTHLSASLKAYLNSGEAKIDRWYQQHQPVLVDCSDCPETFINLNTPEELEAASVRLESA